jgi:molybdate/tungstate transport system substrate-binding protein
MRRWGVSRVVAAGALAVAALMVAGIVVSTSPSAKSGNSSGASTSASAAPLVPLITFNADAYTAEVQALLQGFTVATGIPVAPTHPGGSFALARQIGSGSQVDVFIPVALSAAAPSNLGGLSSNWAIGFASDQMVIAYSNAVLSSSGADAIVKEFQGAAISNSTSDWNTAFASLTSGDVSVGISDPKADPAGLRGWLVLEAAGFYYGGGDPTAYAVRLIQTKTNVTGSAAANMVAPLQAGQFQFLFVYRSVAIAQHLGYLSLDHIVNLGSPQMAASYAMFTYALSTGPAKGAPITLCMTIPANAPDASEAMQFVRHVAKNAGATLGGYGLQPFSPPLLYNNTAPPPFVGQMLSEGLVATGGSLGP